MTPIENLSPVCHNTYFSTQIAIELKSTELAIALQFFLNVIYKHKLMGRNFIDGRTWNYCTHEQLIEYFPFWTEKMIRTRIEHLVKMGILKTSNYNVKKYDRTLWYAFTNEEKWALDKVKPICPNGQMDLPKRANANAQMGTPIPLTKTPTTSSLLKVNDGASPSLTSSINGKGSLYKRKAKYTEDQRNCLQWLKSLNLDTSDDTLSWWARNYTLPRLEEVYRESVKRKPKSLGAYMQKLLKKQAVVVSGRIEINAEFTKYFKDLRNWNDLEIHQKYASINCGNHNIEIDFNMEPESFRDYLEQKYQTFDSGNT